MTSNLAMYAELISVSKSGKKPYREAAANYWIAGWHGVLPLPFRKKSSPPSGFTGNEKPDPTEDKVEEWIVDRGGANICIRLPEDVIALDVDIKDGKTGDSTLADLETAWGALPATWRIVNAGDERVSGHFLFRLPADSLDLKWPGFAGPGIDVLRHAHRYCVAPPSRHPDGRMYYWLSPQGVRTVQPPQPQALPYLPDAWISGITNGEIAGALPIAEVKEPLDWLKQHGTGTPDDMVQHVTARALEALGAGVVSRHDTMAGVTYALAMLAAEGHPGVAAALNDVHEDFVQRVTKDGSRQPREAETEWDRAVQGAVGYAEAKRLGADLEIDEEAFWTALPVLIHLHKYARAQRAAPWAVLGYAMLRVLTAVEPHVELPDIVLAPVSINAFLAVVGKPGKGKGGARGTSQKALVIPYEKEFRRLGSGEGLVHSYVRMRTKDDEPGDGAFQFSTREMFDVDEVSSLGALKTRGGTTLMPELNTAYMGAALGRSTADPTRNLTVGAHRYRMCVAVGVQPANAQVLINPHDVGVGFPQRFWWVSASDPDAPDEAPVCPEPKRWAVPPALQVPGELVDPGEAYIAPPMYVKVCDSAATAIRAQRLKQLRDEDDDEDDLAGHQLLAREKAALAFALLDGQDEITDQYWELSGMFMAHSQQVLDKVRADMARYEQLANRVRGQALGEQRVASDEAAEEMAVRRVSANIRKKLVAADGRWVAHAKLRRELKATNGDRDRLGEAVARLIDAGQATQRLVSGQGQTARQYKTK